MHPDGQRWACECERLTPPLLRLLSLIPMPSLLPAARAFPSSLNPPARVAVHSLLHRRPWPSIDLCHCSPCISNQTTLRLDTR